MPNPINPQVPWSPPPHIQPGLSTQEYSLDYAPPSVDITLPPLPQQSIAAPLGQPLPRSVSPLPPDVPPILAAPGDSLAVQLAIAKANGVPRKRQRTADQVRDSVASATARKLQQAANKAKVARVKATARATKEMIKAAELAAVDSRFKWTEEASLELLAFVKIIKEEHDELSVKQPGFTPFSK
ncbi:hypothetical protein VP01_9712g1 [Puccinia sorghi]|uniref:No apical meristem-associated C-terminal domain-containing protein n=1 Tax=Puccinia sorghi TaxID=27349 RepID=A0A0L6U5Y4_9BASI|nr:hypothetical protein VP01_9712g1 [Puccinia sorghi]